MGIFCYGCCSCSSGGQMTCDQVRACMQGVAVDCSGVMDCVSAAVDPPLTAKNNRVGLDSPALANLLADGRTITVDPDGKLVGTEPFQCKDLAGCIDGTTITQVDGKLQANTAPLNCATLYTNCNVQPLLTAKPNSGLQIVQPADPTTSPAIIGWEGDFPFAAFAVAAITGSPTDQQTLASALTDGTTTSATGGKISTAPQPVETADSKTIHFTGDGTTASKLSATVKKSDAPGNILTELDDGLFASAPDTGSAAGKYFVISRSGFQQNTDDVFFSWAGATPETNGGYTWDGTTMISVAETGLYLIEANTLLNPLISLLSEGIARIVINGNTSEINGTNIVNLATGRPWRAGTNRLGRLTTGSVIQVQLTRSGISLAMTWGCRLAITRLP